MRIKLIYPTWQRIQYQTQYILPPLGITVVAALTPEGHDLSITDENVEPVDFDEKVDLVGISTMLLSQAPRAFAIADEFRKRGVPVVLGGLTVTCIPEEAATHADAIVTGEAEGVWAQVVADAENKALKARYSRPKFASGDEIPFPRRDLLSPEHYTYRGIRMMDLIETSRGCSFGCMPCQVPYVSGRDHRIRKIDAVIDEMTKIPNERIFIVDNAMEQNVEHQKELFQAMKGIGKRWVAHPISVTPDVLKLAAESGCWYVYHAIWKTSDKIRDRVKMLHDYGIGVQATVILGMDFQGPDIFKKMVDFLLENEIDLAEFTVLTPFPGTPFFELMKNARRLRHQDWGKYNAEEVVFRPAQMKPEQLEEGYRYVWDAFYKNETQAEKMFRLYKKLSNTDWSSAVKNPETRVIPNQKGGAGALWGGVVEGLKHPPTDGQPP